MAAGDPTEAATLDTVLRDRLVRLAVAMQRKDEVAARLGSFPAAEAYLGDARRAVGELQLVVREHGWPRLNAVGRDGCDAALVIAQAAGLDEQQRLRPALATAVAIGAVPESHLVHLATLIARASGEALTDADRFGPDAEGAAA